MKVEGGVATTTAAASLLHDKITIKEEVHDCYHQGVLQRSSSPSANVPTSDLTIGATATITIGGCGELAAAVKKANAAANSKITNDDASTMQTSDSPTNLQRGKGSSPGINEETSSDYGTPSPTSSPCNVNNNNHQHQKSDVNRQTHWQHQQQVSKTTVASTRNNDGHSPSPQRLVIAFSDNNSDDQPNPIKSVKSELANNNSNSGSSNTDEDEDRVGAITRNSSSSNNENNKGDAPNGKVSRGHSNINCEGLRCFSRIFATHGQVRRLLGTSLQFAQKISTDTGGTVKNLVIGLLSGTVSIEEFRSSLEEATNYPLRDFVLPYLKQALPALRLEINALARSENQSCIQYLRSSEQAVLEAVGLAPAGEPAELFADHTGVGLPSSTSSSSSATHHQQQQQQLQPAHSRSSGVTPTVQFSHHNVHHFSAAHAPKRKTTDAQSHYEDGYPFEEGTSHSTKRPRTKTWIHQQQQYSASLHHKAKQSEYCSYHPLHVSGGSWVQPNANSNGPIIPNLVHGNNFGHQHQPHNQTSPLAIAPQNGGQSLDDEWKNINVMLNCILGMVDKTKQALSILQQRACPSPASSVNGPVNAPVSSGTPASLSNGFGSQQKQTESSVDREGSTMKRMSSDMVARVAEDRMAEFVKRRTEEAVRGVNADVQRAIAVEFHDRMRTQRYFALNHRAPDGITRPNPFSRAPLTQLNNIESNAITPANSSSNTIINEDDKDNLTQINCWNCGRPALETCGGCGIARYCGSFCQLRDWETGGHHSSCSNTLIHQDYRGRSTTPSPTRTVKQMESERIVNLAKPGAQLILPKSHGTR